MLSEEKLVQELKEGSQTAFKHVVNSYQNMVYNTCLSIVKSEEDAEDIAVYVDFENSWYLLNSKALSRQNDDIYQPFKISVKSVRLRTQKELDLQTFAYLDYKKAGIFKKSIEVGLQEESLTLEEIDAEIVSLLSFLFWQNLNHLIFLLIHHP